jgi:predicted Zn-dependent protease
VWSFDGEGTYVTGHVVLDHDDAVNQLNRGDRAYLVALVMHELGHLVGLGHVQDGREVMNEVSVEALDWGPGDRSALAAVGHGRCDPTF